MNLAFDIELMRPACVLVAACLGADTAASQAFPTESWLLAPTPGMRVYDTTDEQLCILVDRVTKATTPTVQREDG